MGAKYIVLILVLLVVGITDSLADSNPYPGMSCTECHDDKLAKSNLHKPAVKDCTLCHAEHGTDTGNPNRLYSKGNNVCFACHVSTQNLPANAPAHPVSGHPVLAPKDPLYPNREFGCVSCHNPHGSEMPKLFRYDFRKNVTPYAGQSCAVCHFEIYFGNSKPKPPLPPWE